MLLFIFYLFFAQERCSYFFSSHSIYELTEINSSPCVSAWDKEEMGINSESDSAILAVRLFMQDSEECSETELQKSVQLIEQLLN